MNERPAVGLVYLEPIALDGSSSHSAILEVASLATALGGGSVCLARSGVVAEGPFKPVWPPGVELIYVESAWTSGAGLYGPRLPMHILRVARAVARACRRSSHLVVFDADVPSLASAVAARLRGTPVTFYLRGERGYDRRVRHGSVGGRFAVAALSRALEVLTRLLAGRSQAIETSPGLARRIGLNGRVMPWTPSLLVRLPERVSPLLHRPLRAVVVSRLSREKRIEDAIGAVALAAANTDICLTIVGDGPERARLESVGRNSLQAGQIRFAGFIPPGPDLDAEYDKASVALILSETEGRPKAALEALAWGIPLVYTPVGGLPAMLVGSGAGVTVPVGDKAAAAAALREFAEPASLAAASAAARQVASRYTLTAQVRDLTAFLQGAA